jgi:hypothetical protein
MDFERVILEVQNGQSPRPGATGVSSHQMFGENHAFRPSFHLANGETQFLMASASGDPPGEAKRSPNISCIVS